MHEFEWIFMRTRMRRKNGMFCNYFSLGTFESRAFIVAVISHPKWCFIVLDFHLCKYYPNAEVSAHRWNVLDAQLFLRSFLSVLFFYSFSLKETKSHHLKRSNYRTWLNNHCEIEYRMLFLRSDERLWNWHLHWIGGHRQRICQSYAKKKESGKMLYRFCLAASFMSFYGNGINHRYSAFIPFKQQIIIREILDVR